jgi:hypothetical protein
MKMTIILRKGEKQMCEKGVSGGWARTQLAPAHTQTLSLSPPPRLPRGGQRGRGGGWIGQQQRRPHPSALEHEE